MTNQQCGKIRRHSAINGQAQRTYENRKIERVKLIESKNAISLASKLNDAMAELENCCPTFEKIDDCTMLIKYTEEERPQAQIIKINKSDNKPKCKDCGYFVNLDGMIRAERVYWGRCSRYFDAVVNGNMNICRSGLQVCVMSEDTAEREAPAETVISAISG